MKILISGASGLIGRTLLRNLSKKHQIVTLSRARPTTADSFQWNVDEGTLDERALQGVNVVVHLAGARLDERRWNDGAQRSLFNVSFFRICVACNVYFILSRTEKTLNEL